MKKVLEPTPLTLDHIRAAERRMLAWRADHAEEADEAETDEATRESLAARPRMTRKRDDLGPAKGILVGLVLSLLFWFVVISAIRCCKNA